MRPPSDGTLRTNHIYKTTKGGETNSRAKMEENIHFVAYSTTGF